MKKNVVIVGAGPAGLTVGYELLLKYGNDYSITIIEKKSTVGGLCKTVQGKNFSFDIGGHRYFTDNTLILNWWKQFLTEEEFNIVRRSSHIYYHEKMYPYPISIEWKYMKQLGLSKVCRIMISYIAAQKNPKTINTLEDFYISRFGRELYCTFFESYTNKVCGRHPSEIAPEWGNNRVGKLSISSIIFKRSNEQQRKDDLRTKTEYFYYPKDGSGELWNRVEKKILEMGGRVIYEETIKDIQMTDNRIYSITCNNGTEIALNYLISSIPIGEIACLLPNMSEMLDKTIYDLPYRDIIIVGLLFEYSQIEDKLKHSEKLISDQWIYIQDRERKVGRIQLLNNWSSALVKDTKNVGLSMEYFYSSNDDISRMSKNEIIELAVSELVGMGFINSKTVPLEAIVVFEEKAYPSYYGGYNSIKGLKKQIDAINNIACIGRNGQHHYDNIDRVMETAFRAVTWILGECDKKDIWQDD